MTEVSRHLVTFIIIMGWCCYKLEPMGLKSMSNKWGLCFNLVFIGANRAQKIMDDILVIREIIDELVQQLEPVLENCHRHGITLSR